MTSLKEKPTENTKTGSKIDKEVFKAGENNKLSLNQTALVNDIVKNITRDKKKTGAEMYQDNLARQEVSTEVASVEFNKNLSKPKIKATLQEVLQASNINKRTILNTHIDIIDKSIKFNKLNVARDCNKDFMELEGMTTFQPTKQTNIQINIEKMTTNEIDDKLKDIITL